MSCILIEKYSLRQYNICLTSNLFSASYHQSMSTQQSPKDQLKLQNQPFQVQTTLASNQEQPSQNLKKGIQTNDTSTTITSNPSLNILPKHDLKQVSKDQTQKEWNPTSIQQIQEEEGKGFGQQKKQKEKVEEQKDEYEQVEMAGDFIKQWEETVDSQKNWKQEIKQQEQDKTNLKHEIIEGTMFEGQFTYVTKQKKEEDVEQQLQNLEQENRQLEISTEHYINPTTVVQGPLQNVTKQLKKQQIEHQVKQIQKLQQEQISQKKRLEKPKVLPRVNLHQFKSTEVPQLHQQDIPLQHKVEEQAPLNLHTAIQKPTTMPIKKLEPVPVQLKTDNEEQKINPLYIQLPKRQDLPPEYEHYIIPGTMYEGQFTYVSKEKKESEIERQLEEIQEEKRHLKISTQHYINPTTVVQGQIPKANKQIKKQEIQAELRKTQRQKELIKKLKENRPGSQPIIGQKIDQNKSLTSSFQLQNYQLCKKRNAAQGSLQFQIKQKREKNIPIKIDQQSAMTILSSNKGQKGTFTLPKGQEPNYDLEVLVLDAELNKESESPKNAISSHPTHLVNMNRVPDIIDELRTREGSPLKVVISTKQFANYPNQINPSPPIIDEETLNKLRSLNEEQMQKTGERVTPPPKVILSKSSDESYCFQNQFITTNTRRNYYFTSGDTEEEKIFIQDQQDVRKQEGKKKKDEESSVFLIKVVRSLAISGLIGGFTWIGFKDNKITALSAAAGFALTMFAQRYN